MCQLFSHSFSFQSVKGLITLPANICRQWGVENVHKLIARTVQYMILYHTSAFYLSPDLDNIAIDFSHWITFLNYDTTLHVENCLFSYFNTLQHAASFDNEVEYCFV